MSGHLQTAVQRHTLAVSTAGGGLARQYRIQYQAGHPTVDSQWRMYGSFPTRGQAQDCLDELHQRGYHARMVEYCICPAAA